MQGKALNLVAPRGDEGGRSDVLDAVGGMVAKQKCLARRVRRRRHNKGMHGYQRLTVARHFVIDNNGKAHAEAHHDSNPAQSQRC